MSLCMPVGEKGNLELGMQSSQSDGDESLFILEQMCDQMLSLHPVALLVQSNL